MGTFRLHSQEILLDIQHFSLSFHTLYGQVQVVRDLSLSIHKGEVLAIIGESGCGKSVTAKSINRILPEHNSQIDGGKIIFEGKNILEYSEAEMRKIRGNRISMIFQEPMSSLNPTFTIGQQIIDVFVRQHGISKNEAKQKAIEVLQKVYIPSPESRLHSYPHQLSGGMQQRAMIAMALASPNPALLIADEPTTALDVTVQAQVLSLLLELRDTLGLTILLITHDMGLVAQYADRLAVMYCGKIVEEGNVMMVFEKPSHPYTIGLLRSMPSICPDRNTFTPKVRLNSIAGSVPDMRSLGKGCPFFSRCDRRSDVCLGSFPKASTIIHKKSLVDSSIDAHYVYCFHSDETPSTPSTIDKGAIL